MVAAVAFTSVLFLSQTIWAVQTQPNDGTIKVVRAGQASSTQTVLQPPPAATDDKKKSGGGTSVMLNIRTLKSPAHAYGIAAGSSYAGFSEAELNARFADMASMGVTWVRFDIEWSNVQPENSGQGHWDDYDKVVKAARAHNLQVLGIIDYTPGWARPDGCESAQCGPRDPAEYAAFAVKVVNRYSPMGVHAWEVWNEPNNRVFWHHEADAVAYTRILKAAYPAIKQADPNAIVITAGLAPMPNDDGSIARRDFLQQMYNNGAKGYFDAVADHPYTFPRLPDDKSDRAWSEMIGTTPSMRSIMVANGDGDKKIWITEYGAPTGGPGINATPANSETISGTYQVNEELQANILRETARLYKSYDWVGPFFWYSYKDAGNENDNNENFFGLVRYDGSKKQAYDAYKQVIRE